MSSTLRCKHPSLRLSLLALAFGLLGVVECRSAEGFLGVAGVQELQEFRQYSLPLMYSLTSNSLLLTPKAPHAPVFRPLDMGRQVKVSCIMTEPNGGLWLGLDGSGLAYRSHPEAQFQYYSKLEGTLPTDVVLCCSYDFDGRLWFGTFGDGLFYWQGGAFHTVSDANFPADQISYVSAIAQSQDSTYWLGTTMRGLYAWHPGRGCRHYDSSNTPLQTNTITDLETYNHRQLYVATGYGLYELQADDGRISPLTDAAGRAFLEKQMVRYLYQDDDSTLWIGTQSGLYIYDIPRRSYQRLTVDQQLAGNYVKAICRDKAGHIWLTTDGGISCVVADRQPGESVTYRCVTYAVEGNPVFHYRAIGCTSEGQLLFGTSQGCLQTTGVSSVPQPETASSPLSLSTLLIVFLTLVVVLLLIALYTRRRRKGRQALAVEPTPVEVSSADQELIEHVRQYIEEHMDNADLSVADLSAAVGMSRGHLYKRLMQLTGKAPLELMQSIRVKRGKQLLDQSGSNIQQVAWSVGLSPKQFAKYFKAEYGMLPSEYLKK